AQVRLGHDLDQGHARAVEVDGRPAGQPVVQRLARILFEVDATDADPAHLAVRLLQIQPPTGRERAVELRDLVSLGQVRVEVVLAGETAGQVHGAVQAQGRAYAQLDGAGVDDRQGTRQAEAHRTDVRVRFGAELRRVRTEHLGRRPELHVDLQADHRLELHGAASAKARSSAAAARTSNPSCQRSAMSWPPTGRPSTVPIGSESAGTPARFAVTVKMSARYIWYGSSTFSPSGNATEGVVGVRSTSTPVRKVSRKSRAMRPRTRCAVP